MTDNLEVLALIAGGGILVTFLALTLWKRQVAERLDAELTAYVAEGTVSPDLAKAILNSRATLARKRDIAAQVAEGLDPRKALSLLDTMAAS